MSKETAAKSDSWHGRPDSATESNVSEARQCKISRLTWIYLRIQAKLGSWTYPDLVKETINMRNRLKLIQKSTLACLKKVIIPDYMMLMQQFYHISSRFSAQLT